MNNLSLFHYTFIAGFFVSETTFSKRIIFLTLLKMKRKFRVEVEGMKKHLIGLSVAFVAFIGGVFTTAAFLAGKNAICRPPATETMTARKNETSESISRVGKWAELENREAPRKSAEDEDFYGWYSLDTYKEMPEVNMIMLSGEFMDETGKPTKKMFLSAGVFTRFENYGDQGFFEDARAEIKGNRVKFKTVKIKGIEYRF